MVYRDCVYLATFVGTDSQLRPESLSYEVSRLKDQHNFKSSILRRSELELCDEGIRIKDNETKNILDKFSWSDMTDFLAVKGRKQLDDVDVILTFRIIHSPGHDDLYSSQSVVIGICDDVETDKLIDEVNKYRRQIGSSPKRRPSDDVIPAHNTNVHSSAPPPEPSHVSKLRSKSVSSRRNKNKSEGSIDGRCIYLLNRCLDDIHHYAKQLNKCVETKTTGGSRILVLVNAPNTRPPSLKSTIEWLRKIKYCMNLTQEIEHRAPEAASKVFIRTDKMILWMHEICESHILPGHDENLLPGIIEPLLNSQTLVSITKHIPNGLKETWRSLGAAWNTPAQSWPSPIRTYVPQFRTIPNSYLSDYARLHFYRDPIAPEHFSRLSTSDYICNVLSNTGGQRGGRPLVKRSIPYFNNTEQFESYRYAQNHGESLCFATVPHDRYGDGELDAAQGEVFTIVDNADPHWWIVKKQNEDSGRIPSWKLRQFNLSSDMINSVERSQSQNDQQKSTTYMPYTRDDTGRQESMARMMKKEYYDPSTRTITYSPENGDNRRSISPLLVDLPIDEIRRMRDGRSGSIPMLVVPYDNSRQASVDGLASLNNNGQKHLSYSRQPSANSQDDRGVRMPSTDEDLRTHPYPVRPYRSSIVLEARRSTPI